MLCRAAAFAAPFVQVVPRADAAGPVCQRHRGPSLQIEYILRLSVALVNDRHDYQACVPSKVNKPQVFAVEGFLDPRPGAAPHCRRKASDPLGLSRQVHGCAVLICINHKE